MHLANRSTAILPLLLTASLMLCACASGGGGDSAAAEKRAASPRGVAPPAGHPLAKVELRMREDQVRKILGSPDNQRSYPGAIWKNFIPFYFGADSGTRVEYDYAGQGRVVFGMNRWNRQLNVVRVDYDPSEDGR